MIVEIDKNEHFWGGHVNEGCKMPFGSEFSDDLHYTEGNQTNYLILSNKGRIIYSSAPFSFEINNNVIKITGDEDVFIKKVGTSLKDAYLFSMNNFYNRKVNLPPAEFFTAPQFNTWIELIYNQNQKDIIAYAKKIKAEGYDAGVLMIDDNWQEDYGVWDFKKEKFENPKEMINELHRLGFKVMLWVCPFVSPDSSTFRDLNKKGYFVKENNDTPYICPWWNGYSAVLDLSNPAASNWYKEKLNHLIEKYNVDGFKFDAGSPDYYPKECIYYENGCYGYKQSQKFTEFAANFRYSELRETCNIPDTPVPQRLSDKFHSWDNNGINTLIPNSLAQALLGYEFICPDMIGGGEYEDMTENAKNLDQELVVRYAQASALLPMMQFSAAPWRILSEENSRYCKEAAKIHSKFKDYIINVLKESLITREPVIRYLEYEYPNCNYEKINTQFLLGNKLLVAPVLKKSVSKMDVYLPEGDWISDENILYKGGKVISIETPIWRLPYFIKKD